MLRPLTWILLAVTITAVCYGKTVYTKNQVKDIFAVGKECMRTLNIPVQSDIIERVLYNRGVVEDEETLKYMECTTKKVGWIDNEGNVVKTAMIEFFSQNAPSKDVEDILKQCNVFFEGNNVGKKMFNFHQCYYENKKF